MPQSDYSIKITVQEHRSGKKKLSTQLEHASAVRQTDGHKMDVISNLTPKPPIN